MGENLTIFSRAKISYVIDRPDAPQTSESFSNSESGHGPPGQRPPPLPTLCQCPPPPASTHSRRYLCDKLQVIHIVLLRDNEFVDVSLSLSLSWGQHVQEM